MPAERRPEGVVVVSEPFPIPQPPLEPILGNLRLIDPRGPVQSMMKLTRDMGPIVRLEFFGRRLILLSSQALVAEVCDESRFEKSVHHTLQSLRDIGSDGLFTAYTNEPNWGKAHRILMPAFGPLGIRGMFDKMHDIADQMLLRWERFGLDHTFEVSEQMTRLTLDTLALCAFDYRFNSFYQDQMHPFIDAMVFGLAEAGARSRRPGLVNRIPTKRLRAYQQNLAYMNQVADELIAQRKRDPAAADKQDLLHRMLSASDPLTGERLCDENIRYQMVTFLIAGHETTSGLLSFALYLLLQHPEVLARAQRVVDDVLGSAPPTAQHLPELRYIEQVLLESLRLWPTAPAFGMAPRAPTVIGGRYRVTPDEPLIVLVPMLHRDPTVFGPDVEDFRPERFDREREAALPPHAFKPFGTGQRACIGRPFAMQEALLVLSMILQRFDLAKADPSYQLKIKETLTLKPHRFRMRVRRRNVQLRARAAALPTPAARSGEAPAAVPNTAGVVHVLYGSNAGTAKALAERVAEEARLYGVQAGLAPLDDYADRLAALQRVVIVTASYEGQPPDNAVRFLARVTAPEVQPLEHVHYAVFGCGDRQWLRTYQAVPTALDEALARAGAQRLLPRAEGDASGDLLSAFEDWSRALLSQLTAGASERTAAPRLSVEVTSNARASALQQIELAEALVCDNRSLVDLGAPFARDKRHIELELPANLRYRTGDYLAVLPRNAAENVQRALKHFALAADAQLVLSGRGARASTLPLERPISAEELFAGYVELATPATRSDVLRLAELTACPPDRPKLAALAEPSTYAAQVIEQRRSLLDLLETFPACDMPLWEFIERLAPLCPRQYSISSSPLWHERRCTLTVAVLHAPARSGHGTHVGAASRYLATAQPGARISVAVQPGRPHFRPPAAADVPMILIAAGSGLAPFRGFWQERAWLQAAGTQVAKSLLFFGCDHPDVDFLYRDELEDMQARGLLALRTAFYEQPEGEVRFVQHRLWRDRAEALALFRAGATIFVCGDARGMAPAVRKTWLDIFAEALAGDTQGAAKLLADAAREHRYVEDIFG
jgi:cytochrome P450 / NADPH-cytochrome P450 reductase